MKVWGRWNEYDGEDNRITHCAAIEGCLLEVPMGTFCWRLVDGGLRMWRERSRWGIECWVAAEGTLVASVVQRSVRVDQMGDWDVVESHPMVLHRRNCCCPADETEYAQELPVVVRGRVEVLVVLRFRCY